MGDGVDDLSKQVWNPETSDYDYEDIDITDPNATIKYLIKIELGTLSGVNSLDILDILPAALTFANTDETDSVKILHNSFDVTGSYGALSYDQPTHTIKYTIDSASVLSTLPGETLYMELETKLTGIGNLPTYVDNQAQVKVNDGEPVVPPVDPPIVNIKGKIEGDLWHDTTPNDKLDVGELNVTGSMKVVLEKWNTAQSKWENADEVTTTNGKYSFKADLDSTYRVTVPKKDGANNGLVNKDVGTPDERSWADIATGITGDIYVGQTAADKDRIVNAGYRASTGLQSFEKQVHNGTGYVGGPITITNPEQTLWLDGCDAEKIKGKRVALIDDVIATGESIGAIESLAKQAGAIVVAKAAILAELESVHRPDVIYLKEHFVFRPNPDGSFTPLESLG